jgi:hypothetical protein
MSETIKLQQEAIYELLSTEVSYIRQILTMTDILMTSISILKSSQRDGIFNDIDMEKLFSNIQDVLHGNILFWKEILLPIKLKLKQNGLPMNPSDLKNGFIHVKTNFFFCNSMNKLYDFSLMFILNHIFIMYLIKKLVQIILNKNFLVMIYFNI